ncbi:hypothetical protein ACFPQ1_26990 [Rhodocytophaga aerolata]|uniref:hypothetical protein n=1 Tax=Rhodocytophaga aerolata TaxID=455078 RepID=UPI003613DE04
MHYNTAVLPTRAYKPRDKALVEGAVRIVYNRIFTHLQKRTFCSLQALNEAIKAELESYNGMLFQGKAYSRKDLFVETDKAALLPLPAERFQLKYYLTAKVYKNTHVWLGTDKHWTRCRAIVRSIIVCLTATLANGSRSSIVTTKWKFIMAMNVLLSMKGIEKPLVIPP